MGRHVSQDGISEDSDEKKKQGTQFNPVPLL